MYSRALSTEPLRPRGGSAGTNSPLYMVGTLDGVCFSNDTEIEDDLPFYAMTCPSTVRFENAEYRGVMPGFRLGDLAPEEAEKVNKLDHSSFAGPTLSELCIEG
ncbi:hypothetical protein PT974_08165 [Cladobotryum mycophilum]|uniref:Uncharacterized protein n=1 Tax=Cladobotryum mycophilum TaxID=491253 RepID=A0ABR0SCK9_9HYPO